MEISNAFLSNLFHPACSLKSCILFARYGTSESTRVSYKPAVCKVQEMSTSLDISPLRIHDDQFHYPNEPWRTSFPEDTSLKNGTKGCDNTLKQLAGIDSSSRQSVYQQELLEVSQWWNELGFAKELKLVRNQPLKWYTWSMAALIDDISLSRQRIELTKSIAFVHLIDDIFDLYGMPDELKIFTEAVNKWDYAAIDILPDYMRMCYKALLDSTNEMALNIYKVHGYNPIDSLKALWASLCNAFLVEANWFASSDFPTAEKYLENGIVSSGVHVVLVNLFFLLGLGGTNNVAVNLKNISELVTSAATILRLWDDLGSAKDEHQDGKDGSYIEYYMKDHISVSIEQAREHVMSLIESSRKRLNKECSKLNHCSALPFSNACLNLARMAPLMYNYDSNQSLHLMSTSDLYAD